MLSSQPDALPGQPLPPQAASVEEVVTFTDYELVKGKRLGSGYWSDVYAGVRRRRDSTLDTDSFSPMEPTPPATPEKKGTEITPDANFVYAVKVPAQHAANEVLRHEAKVLTLLRSKTRSSSYIVPFYGFDPRNSSLILGLLPQSLEDYVLNTLASLPEAVRTTTLASAMPRLAHHLITGLEFMHGNGIIHADIKPSNILLQPFHTHGLDPFSTATTSSIPVYADFSSSITITANADPDSDAASAPQHQAPLGGGSWDFLSPNLVKIDKSTGLPPDPTTADDVYALAITLLYTIIGRSPYASQGRNVFQRREMVKAGRAVEFATDDPQNADRLRGVTRAVQQQQSQDGKTVGEQGFSFRSFLNLGLKRVADERVTAADWKKWLDAHGVCEPEELEDWNRVCGHGHQV